MDDLELRLSELITTASDYSLPSQVDQCKLKEFFKLLVNNKDMPDILSIETLPKMIVKFMDYCEDDFLLETVVQESFFWTILIATCSRVSLVEMNFVMKKLFTICLDDQTRHKKHLVTIMRSLYVNPIFVQTYTKYVLQSAENLSETKLALEIFSLHFECLSSLSFEDLSLTVAIIMRNFINLNELREFFSNLIDNDDVSDTLFKSFTGIKYGKTGILSRYSLQEYEGPLKDRYFNALKEVSALSSITNNNFTEETKMLQDEKKITLLQAYDAVNFLENSNLSFKKTYSEQLLFGISPFPLSKALVRVSIALDNYSTNLRLTDSAEKFIIFLLINNASIYYIIMERILNMWAESDAKTGNDLESLLDLIPIIIDKSMTPHNFTYGCNFFKTRLKTLENISYKVARNWQLDTLRQKHYSKWSGRVIEFDAMLTTQVYEYVRHQRLLQLQNGSWVYAENPLAPDVQYPRVAFIVLSANQNNILLREFDIRPEELPQIGDNRITLSSDKNLNFSKSQTKVVRLSDIFYFEGNQITIGNNVPDDFKMVNLIQKSVYVEINLSDRNHNVLLNLYFDTKETTYVWLDGLRLISSLEKHKDSISQSTKEQIETLVDVRKNVQLINLSVDYDIDLSVDDSESESDEDIYNLDHLKNIASNFYYD
ncbi:hypothetical protein TBLA_0C03640 [Henningerozyma blattae CBS 6284]|uniref:PH domain-containing protein n=1 Tax=Henningerozyma blattae (strain ATCC 34711 / CBS 6284 / DSM 70876 / NBRC 10599 / NRRL Y-10934 / UCD 77-7) TaxID=1071380 RepID=I2H1B5_HENB6|nr:hypothetical protein TBLA_0C03640 [Tetrapisispora blattae CBS 6284]CCH60167.1 hypothetical protein TBLA_0C03640 [Tetrapisispora blattae CBS 6284]